MRTLKKLIFAFLLFPAISHSSVIWLDWDLNQENDMAGYRLFKSTFSLLNVSTTAAMGDTRIAISELPVIVSTTSYLKTGTTFYYRLTAFDQDDLQSDFNVDNSGSGTELVVFLKPGDTNKDMVVNLADLSILLRDFGTNKPEADFDDNKRVDIVDLSRLLFNWGK